MSKNIKIINKFKLNETEKVLLSYFLVVIIFIALFSNRLNNVENHITNILLFTFIILTFAFFDEKFKNNSFLLLIRNIYPLLFLGYLYKETGYLNNIIFDYFDPWFVKAEHYLWGMQPSLEFSKHFSKKWFSELMNFGYFFYYLLTPGTTLAVFFFKRDKLKETVFIIINSFLIYYLFFILFPVEGPQYYFPPDKTQTVDSYLFSHLVKLVQQIGETQTGAFPSSHVGMSVVFLIINYKYARNIFRIIIIPVIFLWFATVYIKAHYLIDTIAGFPSGILVYWLSLTFFDKMNKNK
jgi:membrane-associated phospholipid phosphatase